MAGPGSKAAGPGQMPGIKCQAGESAPPASGSPAKAPSPGLQLQDHEPLPRLLARWPALVSRGPWSLLQAQSALHPLDGSQCYQEFPSACPPSVWPFPFLLRKSLFWSPSPARKPSLKPALGDFRAMARSFRARVKHGVALPQSPASSPCFNPTVVPFPPPGNMALKSCFLHHTQSEEILSVTRSFQRYFYLSMCLPGHNVKSISYYGSRSKM